MISKEEQAARLKYLIDQMEEGIGKALETNDFMYLFRTNVLYGGILFGIAFLTDLTSIEEYTKNEELNKKYASIVRDEVQEYTNRKIQEQAGTNSEQSTERE